MVRFSYNAGVVTCCHDGVWKPDKSVVNIWIKSISLCDRKNKKTPDIWSGGLRNIKYAAQFS